MLNSAWEKLLPSDTPNFFRTIRIEKDCNLDLFLARSYNGNRCLLLPVSDQVNFDFVTLNKSHLSLTHEKELSYLVLILKDDEFFDIFNDLIFSFYNAIKREPSIDKAAKVFINTFVKWNVLFEKNLERKFSKTNLIGVFGELVYLKSLLEMSPCSVNNTLLSWKGPYDEVHDFEFEGHSVEIKTKLASTSNIFISSEYQLERKDSKNLSLNVIDIEENLIKGISIFYIFNQIKNIITSNNGNLEVFLTALYQLKLNEKVLMKYDNWRFVPISNTSYECEHAEFPRLVSSGLNNSIRSVKYTLYLNELDNFIIKKELF